MLEASEYRNTRLLLIAGALDRCKKSSLHRDRRHLQLVPANNYNRHASPGLVVLQVAAGVYLGSCRASAGGRSAALPSGSGVLSVLPPRTSKLNMGWLYAECLQASIAQLASRVACNCCAKGICVPQLRIELRPLVEDLSGPLGKRPHSNLP